MNHNPNACYWCRQSPCRGNAGNGSCTERPPVAPPPASPDLKFSPAAEAHLDALEAASPEPGSAAWNDELSTRTVLRKRAPASPEPMPEHVDIPICWGVPGMRVEMRLLRALLATQGLSVCTEAERQAMAATVRIVADWIDEGDEQDADTSMQQIETVLCIEVAAELARRGER